VKSFLTCSIKSGLIAAFFILGLASAFPAESATTTTADTDKVEMVERLQQLARTKGLYQSPVWAAL
jgi:hypothetical protein